MTKAELLKRLIDLEWDDFECKEALNKLPDNVLKTHLSATSPHGASRATATHRP